MKTLFVLFLVLSGCGYSALNSEFTGQVKYVENVNPILCDQRVDAGITLGVMRNGTGSVSTHDIIVTVPDKDVQAILRSASESGAIVKMTYDQKRLTWCWHEMTVTKAEVLK